VNRSLRVCSTPQALRGLRPSELDPGSIGARFPALTPASLSVSQGFHPMTTPCPHARLTPTPSRAGITTRSRAPRPLRDRLPSQTSTDLGVLLPIRSVSVRQQFHPQNVETTLLVFPPSGFSPRTTTSLATQPSRGFDLLRVYQWRQRRLHLAVAPTLLAFLPYGRELSLQPTWVPRLLLPFRFVPTVTG